MKIFSFFIAASLAATATATVADPVQPMLRGRSVDRRDLESFALLKRQNQGQCLDAVGSGCGLPPGPCNQNGCDGTNLPGASLGICQSSFRGCTCTTSCGSLSNSGKCNENGCQGINPPTPGNLGICTAGSFVGCACVGVCGSNNGRCDQNGCNGVGGVCQSGDFAGCNCN
jgi:hypothetical protein